MRAAKVRVDVKQDISAELAIECGLCGEVMRRTSDRIPDHGRIQCECGEINDLHQAQPRFSEMLERLQEHTRLVKRMQTGKLCSEAGCG